MKRLIWVLETAIVIVVSFPLAVLPYKCSLKAGKILGLLLFYLWTDRRRIAAANIERAIQSGAIKGPGPAEKIARESFINFGKSFSEVVKVYYGLGWDIVRNVKVEGREHFNRAKARGRGVILITGHCGNWELLALATGMKVAPISVVARPQNNPYLNRMIEKVRSRYNNSVIYKKGALKGILSRLKNEGVVGILMDQAVISSEGFVIDFLGMGAWTTKMPALMARKTGAAVIPIFINRKSSSHVITISPEVSIRLEDGSENSLKDDTQRMSGYVEEYIRQHPAEWLWIHRRWKRVNDN